TSTSPSMTTYMTSPGSPWANTTSSAGIALIGVSPGRRSMMDMESPQVWRECGAHSRSAHDLSAPSALGFRGVAGYCALAVDKQERCRLTEPRAMGRHQVAWLAP